MSLQVIESENLKRFVYSVIISTNCLPKLTAINYMTKRTLNEQ